MATILIFLLSLSFISAAQAFNSLTHVQILESAIDYIEHQPSNYPHALVWIKQTGFRKLMTRAIVDADFEPDLWLSDSLLHESVPASSFGILNSFSTLLHHVDTQQAGKYWNYDGFNYSGSARRGRDLFLLIPGVHIDRALSSSLGGQSPFRSVYGEALGDYRNSFHGTDQEWDELYSLSLPIWQVVFPPAFVPAGLAYHKMLASPRALSSIDRKWDLTIPAISLTGMRYPLRHYSRSELIGLPQSLDLLGLTLHLAEDMGVPQHTQSTVDLCHTELELASDRLTCEGVEVAEDEFVNQTAFVSGEYDRTYSMPKCQALYHPEQIKKVLNDNVYLSPKQSIDASQIVLQTALVTSKWRFEKKRFGYFKSIYNGIDISHPEILTAKTCEALINSTLNRKQMRAHLSKQYSLAVAVTVSLLESAALSYEASHSGP